MTHSTIAQRLTLLTAVPLIALILSAGMLVWDSFTRYQNANQARMGCPTSTARVRRAPL